MGTLMVDCLASYEKKPREAEQMRPSGPFQTVQLHVSVISSQDASMQELRWTDRLNSSSAHQMH